MQYLTAELVAYKTSLSPSAFAIANIDLWHIAWCKLDWRLNLLKV